MSSSSNPDANVVFETAPGELLYAYNLHASALDQSQSKVLPHTLLDSFHIREQVFVREQNVVPLKHHLDRDDARSFHWVLYASISPSEQTPVGTIRLLPYPVDLHPTPGASFEAPGEEVPSVEPETLFSAPLPKFVADRATSLHDGIEPYIKLGRLCVLKEYRGRRYADLLIQSALDWARSHPDLAGLSAGSNEGEELPKWKGLVCIHARAVAVGTWSRNGFVVDEGMGTWLEGGMKHVGMFCRLELNI